jgi:hypothetical protein
MKLFANRNGGKFYDNPADQALIAKHGGVVLGVYPGWKSSYGLDRVLRVYKALNPAIKVFGYMMYADQYDDGSEPAQWCRAKNWYAKSADGTPLQWTTAYDYDGIKRIDVNHTATNHDDHGLNHAERFVDWWMQGYPPAPGFDGHFVDNFGPMPMSSPGDWLGKGVDVPNSDPPTALAHRIGMMRGVTRIRKNDPKTIVMANTDDASSPEYKGKLDGIFREGLMGKSWSIEPRLGWPAMMDSYRSAMACVKPGGMVVFGTFDTDKENQPRVGEDRNRQLRYGLTSCLLDDGWFNWTPTPSAVPAELEWWPEFDIDLGTPVDPPATAVWSGGAYLREYTGGVVLCNPTDAPVVNVRMPRGHPVYDPLKMPIVRNAYWTVPARDGLVLKK